MLCQHCQKNEATKVFIGRWMGRQGQWHICDECLNHMWDQAVATGHSDAFRAISGWWPGKETPRESGGCPFPSNADAGVKARRRKNELRYRLEEAASREDYAEAARLRDSIAELEQERWSHEL